MEYAIIEQGGKQYKVSPGGIVELDRMDIEPGKSHVFDKVLLYTADGVCKIGRPQVEGVTVTGKILDQIKGEKIRVAKFKAKARYRRVQGHRAMLTRVQIIKIETVGVNKEPAEKAKIKKIKDKE